MSDTDSGHLDDQQHHSVTEGRETNVAAAAKSTDEVRGETKRSIVTEVGIFCVGIGVLLGVVGGLLLATGPDDPRMFGLPRNLVLGTPIVIVAILNLASGFLVLVIRNAGTVVLCILAGTSVPVTYAGVMLVTGVGLHFNCISIVMIAVPAGLLLRGREALAELSGRRTLRRERAERQEPVWRSRDVK